MEAKFNPQYNGQARIINKIILVSFKNLLDQAMVQQGEELSELLSLAHIIKKWATRETPFKLAHG